MKKIRLATSCSALTLLIASLPGNAENFAARLSYSGQYSDNAFRTQADQISEWQDEFSLGALGEYENRLLDLAADYTVSAYRFDKDSQPDRELLEGNSHLRLGKENQFFDLLLQHSRSGVLSSPEAIDVLSNRDERDIYSVVPTIHTPLTMVDGLMLRGSYTEVKYRYNEERDTEATGASLIWQHKLSAIDRFEVGAQQAEVEFKSAPESNYEYQSAMINYFAELRQLNYNISVGYNNSKPETGEEYSSPLFTGQLSYASGTNTFTLYADQRITDTSMGDGNRLDFDGNFAPGDVGSTEIDQIERRSLELGWSNQMLCDRCSLDVTLLVRDDKYVNLPQDNSERGGSIGLSYQLSSASGINLRFSRRDQQFNGERAGEEFIYDQARVEYSRTFFRDINVQLFAENRERKSESGITDYEEVVSGLSLTYHF